MSPTLASLYQSRTLPQSLEPRDKPYKLYDDDGMCVLVHPNGSKYFRLKYRTSDASSFLLLASAAKASAAAIKKSRQRWRLNDASGLGALDAAPLCSW